ncbi:MAG: hypothetical protein A2W91_14990 [Bacteroidetes bacterium GWF2_38_335]|nr:MAG: hypothetical protein A2W91_14990 [Bacteroidetes bacterium GWF2_38_335]OFY78503.1 MAG: hypothetical protein A2281_16300 [Bacteroidetes bacterium RIFOXYA12_FULL_38_20]
MKRFFPFLLILICVSCSHDEDTSCFMSWGNESYLSQDLNSFDTIEVNDLFVVRFYHSDDHKIVIRGGENVIKGIDCQSDGHTLVIKNQNVCNWLRTYKKDITLEIYSPEIKKIILNGESDLYCEDTLETDTFFLMVYGEITKTDLKLKTNHCILKINAGTGKFTFRGKSRSSYVYSHGTSFIYQSDLQTEYSHLVNYSTGDIFVNTTGSLFVEYNDRGNIYYKGNPGEVIVAGSSGIGEVIKMED